MSSSNVAFCVPSGRPVDQAADCLLKWHRQGYKVVVTRDQDDDLPKILEANGVYAIVLICQHAGYANAVNLTMKKAFEYWPEMDWACTGGDDTLPDPDHHPDQIAGELTAHFGGTFGMAQPTGDRWADGSIDNIAGSPWIGREWARRAHAGLGPLCPLFYHMEVDVAALWAAEREGVYLRRPDLIHKHNHFCRTPGDEVVWTNPVPPHLAFVNSDPHKIEARQRLEEFKRDYEVSWKALPA